MYVLVETDKRIESILGVFDHTIEDISILDEYYGFVPDIKFERDIDESGIKWEKHFFDDNNNHIKLTLLEFETNAI
tara:strand:+ start:3738 stop:3965 length:228 start_codon:yes stop_codon:yes gene_type:complete